MKKFLFWVGAIIMSAGWNAICFADAASPELSNSLKTNSHEPNFFSIVFALLFVIFLIYITGIIYSKLNLVGAKTVKEQFKGYNLDRAVVLSTTQLGQGKNLHVINVNNKHFLIGATANSITLIKELEDINENEYKQKTVAERANVEPTEQETPVVENEFDVHKKYL